MKKKFQIIDANGFYMSIFIFNFVVYGSIVNKKTFFKETLGVKF